MEPDTFLFEVGSERDVFALRDFFRDHFRMTLLSEEDADDYVILTDGQVRLGFLYGDKLEQPNQIDISFTVDDLEAEVSRLASEGVPIPVQPETFSWARAASYKTPQGIGGWLIQRGSWTLRERG